MTDEKQDDDPSSSNLEESMDGLRELAAGVAAKLLGSNAVSKLDIDPQRTVLSPEADRAIEDLGASLGRFLSAAGDELQKAARPGSSTENGPSTESPATDAPAPEDAEPSEADEGWSPLVIGAKSFAEGIGAVASGLLEKVPTSSESEEE